MPIAGTRIGNETLTYLSAEAKIRPLRNRIILEPLEWKPSNIIPVVYWGKPLRGIVKAIGPGSYPKRYNGPKGKRTKSWDSKCFVPTELQVGDEVELGGLELGGYLFPTFWWGGTEHVVVSEDDVTWVYEH